MYNLFERKSATNLYEYLVMYTRTVFVCIIFEILTVTWVILLLNASLLQLFDCCSKCALFDSTFFFFFSGTVYSAFAWIRHWECRRM